MQHTREDHRNMILDPYKWPHMSLPLKRFRNGHMETALLWAGMNRLSEDEPLQIKANTTLFGNLPGGPDFIDYDNVDALLDDGWVVD